MKIIYTKHAEEMLAFRRLGKELVKKCVENPSKILPAKEGRKVYLKDLGKNFLKVVVSEEERTTVIITAYWIAKEQVKM